MTYLISNYITVSFQLYFNLCGKSLITIETIRLLIISFNKYRNRNLSFQFCVVDVDYSAQRLNIRIYCLNGHVIRIDSDKIIAVILLIYYGIIN